MLITKGCPHLPHGRPVTHAHGRAAYDGGRHAGAGALRAWDGNGCAHGGACLVRVCWGKSDRPPSIHA
eukprot:scaffold56511_cov22-Tisochrysis_lutea.AAC.1